MVATRPGRRRTRRARWLLIPASLTAAWLLTCWAVLDHPRVDQPHSSDAVLVLGPPDPQRMHLASELMAQGVAPVLVIATPEPRDDDPPQLLEYYNQREFCEPHPDYEVICFRPNPSTTQGEAMHLRELAHKNQWESVAAVTFTQHVPRARLILQRCYPGELHMVATDYQLSWRRTIRQYAYQSGGFVKAWLTPGCDQQLPGQPKQWED